LRKLVASLVLLSLAAVLVGAGVLASARAYGAAPHIITDGPMTLQLSSTMPGVTFNGNTLICPALLITTSSGVDGSACEFTIESIGTIRPNAIAVNMTVSGTTAAQLSGKKFAIAPQLGPLVHPGTSSKTIYTFTGSDLPVTVRPGLAWGANAGGELDNSDLGATIVVTYTVVAESLEGATGSPVPTQTPFESVEAATGAPGQTSTPPPTVAASGQSGHDSSPLFALLICFLLAVIGLIAAEYQRRSVRH
jgi:hypothetical protein